MANTVLYSTTASPGSICLFDYLRADMDKMEKKVKKQKQHQHKQSGPKAEKKKLKKQESSTENEGRRNPKAFAVQSAVRMAKTFHRSVLTLTFSIRHVRCMQHL